MPNNPPLVGNRMILLSNEIIRNQALTPDKASSLINDIQTELNNANAALQSTTNPSVQSIIQNTSENLQNSLNSLLAKKGIITPNETNNALDAIDASKRARLQQDFTMGIKNTTLYIGALIVLVGGYFIIKKMKKK
jgi:subtilase family serine protease